MENTLPITIDKNDFEPHHIGDFLLRLPTILEEIEIGKREKDLCGQFKMLELSPAVQDLIICVAALEVVVKEAPPWWWVRNEKDEKVARNLLEMTDSKILTMIYAEYFSWRHLPDLRGKGDGGGPEPGEPADVEAGQIAGQDANSVEEGD